MYNEDFDVESMDEPPIIKKMNETSRHQSATPSKDLSWAKVSGLLPSKKSFLGGVARLHRPSQVEEISFIEDEDDEPLKPTKELESQYGSNKQKRNEIEDLLLSLVMDNNDETLKLQYESELGIPNNEANGPMIVI